MDRLLSTEGTAYKQINNELFENLFLKFIKKQQNVISWQIYNTQEYQKISLSVHGNYSDNAQ